MINNYFAFINKKFVLFCVVEIIALLLLAVVLEGPGTFYPTVLMVLFPVLQIIVFSMMDFFSFGAIAVKKQKLMEFVKSSFAGHKFIKDCLIMDAILIFVKMLVLTLGIMIIAVICNEDMFFSYMNLLFLISIAALSTLLLFVSQIVTRKFCQSLTAHMLIAYLLNSLLSIAYMPVLIVLSAEGAQILATIMTLLLLVLAFFAGWGLVYLCLKGYDSGFCD